MDSDILHGETKDKEIQETLVKLIILGNIVDDRKLRNLTTRALAEFTKDCVVFPTDDTLDLIWASTAARSSLRSMILAMAFSLDFEVFLENGPGFPRGLIFGLAGMALQQPLAFSPLELFIDHIDDFLEPEEPQENIN